MSTKLEIKSVYNLSPMQEGMLFHSLLNPDSPAYYEQLSCTINGTINVQILEQSFNLLIEKYDILRTNFMYENIQKPKQIVFKKRKINITFKDISHMDELQQKNEIDHYKKNDKNKSFNLSRDFLLRMSVFKKSEREYVLIWSYHHILMDGWGLQTIVQEIFETYHQLKRNLPVVLEDVPVYSDYIKWLDQQDHDQARLFWNSYLKNYDTKAMLPKNNVDHKQELYHQEETIIKLDKIRTEKLQNIAKKYKVTLNVLLQASWGILLSQYNNTRDVVFGMVTSGRPAEIENIEKMIGLFINTIPVRINYKNKSTFDQLIKQIQETSIEKKNVDFFPLAEIQSGSSLKQDLIDHIFWFQNFEDESLNSVDHEEFQIVDYEDFEQTNYDFNVVFMHKASLEMKFKYNAVVYNKRTIDRIGNHFKNIISAISENPEVGIQSIQLVTKDELKQMTDEFNNTSMKYQHHKLIHQLFEEQVKRDENKIAAVCGDQKITYGKLNEKANQLANTLRSHGVNSGSLVGIMLHRSIDMFVGILGVLKAGGAYLPIDPEHPSQRIQYMLKDAQAEIILLHPRFKESINTGTKILYYEDRLFTGESNNLVPVNSSKDLAYTIYTSGSTGKPKGVMISHQAIHNFIEAMCAEIPFRSNKTILALTTISFDIFVLETILPLVKGLKVVIADEYEQMDPIALNQLIVDQAVDMIQITPSRLKMLITQDPKMIFLEQVKEIMIGGEALPVHLLETIKQFSNLKIFNMYGPTETTVWSCVSNLTEKSKVDIGKPIANTQVYILDENNQCKPMGIPGELCISGDGLALGYLNKEQLTAEKFTDHPFIKGQKIYHTGDLAKWDDDGTIEYMGRTDFQVKIRGYRIELEEIETVILNNKLVQEVVVIGKEDTYGNQYLCAYYVSKENIPKETLMNDLVKELPDYMIPSHFICLDHLPLNQNGKVDRKALPEPDLLVNSKEIYVEPQLSTEKKLAQIWEEILGVSKVGLNDHFFHLGGHSLKSITLYTRMNKEFNSNFPLKEIFKTPRLRDMANRIMFAGKKVYDSIEPAAKADYYAVSSAQKRLMIINQIEGYNTAYNMPFVLKLEGDLNTEKLRKVFKALIQRHETFRTSFKLKNEEPIQKIKNEVIFEIEQFNIQNYEQLEYVLDRFIAPFDLQQAPLLRVCLARVGKNTNYLIGDMHHIISDGTSIGLLVHEFSTLYNNEELDELSIQYKDFSAWQNQRMESLNEQRKYWVEQFSGEIPVLNMPTDFPRPQIQTFEGDRLSIRLDHEMISNLNKMCSDTETTLNMMMLTAYYILLSKYTRQDDIVVGSPISGRSHADLENMMGMFVGTLPLRNYPKGEKTFKEFLNEVKDNILHALENQEYQYEQLIEQLDIERDLSRNPLFDTMFAVQNIENTPLKMEGLQVEAVQIDSKTSKFDLTFTVEEDEAGILLEVEYATKLFKKETIERLANHYLHILHVVIRDLEINISEIDMLSSEEKNQIFNQFNDTTKEYPKDKTIQQCFEEQVKRNPNSIAMVSEDIKLTYKELNEKANHLALLLRKEGVKADSIVAIMQERSMELVIAMLATLKAGGAYLPIDPEYPVERVEYILQDSEAEILLTQTPYTSKMNPNLKMFELEQPEKMKSEADNLEIQNRVDHLSYIIYTSGSTGKPKGVMVEHQNVVRLVKNTNYVSFDEGDRILQIGAQVFDACTFEIWGALLNGLELYIVDQFTILSPNKLEEAFKKYKITTIFLTSPFFTQLSQYKPEMFAGIKTLLVGGDVISPKNMNEVRKKCPGLQWVHVYGPTENTTFSTYFNVDEDYDVNIPIGFPIHNSTSYIVDQNGKLVPIGVPGEIWVGGDGVARGYKNLEELTSTQFIVDPFAPEGKIYRTGDMAKWLPDGSIEFIGRIDKQVKIRGFRVEVGEIESQILTHPNIKETVVVVYEQNQSKPLCAYLVLEKELSLLEVKEYLKERLPEYMVPSSFVFMDKLPLNPNGKIDRKALPEPKLNIEQEIIPPTTELEEILVEIWEKVLGVEPIGTHHNFFELGGDSIKAIQMVSKLNSQGYTVTVKDLFQNPEIIKLSKYVQLDKREANQAIVENDVELSPIQKWFFDSDFTDKHHFNQAVMLYRKDGFEVETLQKAFTNIIQHHDALRMVYPNHEGKLKQYNRGLEGPLFDLTVEELSENVEYEHHIAKTVERIHHSINLGQGPLVKLGLFKTNEGDHLLIVIHHLVIDGVSWRILFEDLTSTYMQLKRNETIQLPKKTDSYLKWSNELKKIANEIKFLKKEKAYWNKIESSNIIPIPKDNEQVERKGIDSQTYKFQLSVEETTKLLTNVHKAYNTEMNDILLCALGLSLKKWTGENQFMISLEGHGREEVIKDINIGRTIGWFTSIYPVRLNMKYSTNLSNQIKHLKEKLRQIPNKGIGYGMIKYLTSDDLKTKISSGINPEISFNYLGQFDTDVNTVSFESSPLSVGEEVSTNSERQYVLDIISSVENGMLNVSITYDVNEYKSDTMIQFASYMQESLDHIIQHCVNKGFKEITPSDVGAKDLSIHGFESLPIEKSEIKRIYNLSPMQEGMLFHSLLNPESSAYFEQLSSTIRGKIDIDVLEKSFHFLVEKYDILRTNFMHSNLKRPKQVVFKNKKLKIQFKDFSHLKQLEIQNEIRKFKIKDKEYIFDLTKDDLFRMSVLKITDDQFEVIWSFHHILMDGWCLQPITQELFEIYHKLKHNDSIVIGDTPSYSNYIEWLDEQDYEEAKTFWEQYLSNYEMKATLPTSHMNNDIKPYKQVNKVVKFSRETTQKLEKIAKDYHITLNTIFQTAWGILLSKYNHTNDVVFGMVTSGRPAEIKNVDKMIGLFINTIPIRIKVESKQSFSDLITHIHQDSILKQNVGFFPLAEIQSLSSLKQDLIDHLFAFQNFGDQSTSTITNNGFEILKTEEFEQTNYDFNIMVIPNEQLEVRFKYNASVYEQQMIDDISVHYHNILQIITDEPNILIKDIEILSDKEKDLILVDFNHTKHHYPKDKTIQMLFEEQAQKHPDHIAVVCEDVKLTYAELNEKANHLANRLKKEGVKADTVVAMMQERSIELIIGMLAVLKAGGAYLPIDPDYPSERVEYLLADSEADILLTKTAYLHKVNKNITVIELEKAQHMESEVNNLSIEYKASHLAYMMYTSGSTGKPKGVMVEQQNVVRLVKNTNYVTFAEGDRILQTGAEVFDACTFEIWGALLNGLELYVVDKYTILSPEKLEKTMKENKITTMWLTSPLFNQLSLQKSNMFDQLNTLIVGGDVLTPKRINDVKKHCPNLTVVNGYGPTENTTFSCCYAIHKTHESNIPIGQPIHNSTAYIVDPFGKLAPVGVPGELWVGGDGVARGYKNLDTLTSEKFISNPFVIDKQRCYRTGDLARWLPDGNIEYIGRMDNQLKIRGFRVEVGEIERQILKNKDVKESVVIPKEHNQMKYLCAYIVTDKVLSVQEMKMFLESKLPDYMIPSAYVFMDKFPLNQNGKVDRKVLPEPDFVTSTDVDYVQPRNEIEKQILDIWCGLLNVERISIHDDFFEIGGHSLKAIQLVSELAQLGYNIRINDVFTYQTPEKLAKLIYLNDKKQNVYIDDIYRAEEFINKKLNIKSQLHQFDVDDNDKPVIVLFVEGLNEELMNQIVSLVDESVDDKIKPHYIVEWIELIHDLKMSREDFDKVIRSKQLSSHMMLDEILKEIETRHSHLERDLINRKVIDTYQVSPSQKYHLEQKDFSGTAIKWDKYLHKDVLDKAFLHLLSSESTMRSILEKDAGIYYWKEHEPVSEAHIPFVDLSSYDKNTTKKIINFIMDKYFLKEYKMEHSLLFRACLIKENLRDHVLLLPFSHVVFDYMSSEIIKNKLNHYYQKISLGQSVKIEQNNRFKTFIQQIQKGPQSMNDQQIMDEFKLKEFERLSTQIESKVKQNDRSKYSVVDFETRITNGSWQMNSEEIWELSLDILCNYFQSYFEISKVPLWVTNYGRRFGSETYFNTIGEFIDYIPILVNGEASVNDNAQQIKEKLKWVPEKNIHFANLMYNDEMKKDYPISNELLFKSFKQIPINFNYLGELKVEDDGLRDLDTGHINSENRSRIINMISYDHEKLYISIILPYIVDQNIALKQLQKAAIRHLTKKGYNINTNY
ncbi:non-ribosomal peptide synthetase [Chengkuizengella marina]|uniref:Amino acid adenylation domain-containing protein n=1 Tax=Chengkuizengella marina TaxID=2507566 RepID=A0A6N9Q5D0_9BACL|nr:non-ribosomal peptide synthetase [Chengkuizengella marina]NBI30069.1 amino acid adenylation domain-containing protein [Chengkuizengella marina]